MPRRLSLRERLAAAFAHRASRAGWGAALVLGPHLVLGAWLLVVPDQLAFVANEVVLLVHVALALLVLPVVVFWVWRHARRMPAPSSRLTRTAKVARWTLVGGVAVALLSGYLALWGGDIIPTNLVHEVCGLAVALPFAWHLWLGNRRLAAGATVALVAVALGGSAVTKRLLPAKPLEAKVPKFAYETRPAKLYESAEDCAKCHVQEYEEWKRSTHARTQQLSNVNQTAMRLNEMEGFNLAAIGRIIDGARPPHADQAIFTCEACHQPTSYYGDDTQPFLHAKGVAAEGVTCTFCHTVRDVRDVPPSARADVRETGTADFTLLLRQLPSFVSAPETVRRYLGQGSTNPLASAVGDWLIRWRPEVHRADYHSPVLDSSLSCMPCHGMGGLDAGPEVPHKTWISWKQGPFNTGDPKTTTTCQDCHMVRSMTGRPVVEAGREVPWGPPREGVRSHLMLGGNVNAPAELGDHDLAALQHAFNTLAASVAIKGVDAHGPEVAVTVDVKSERVGHFLPSMETHMRYLWVEASALDAGGAVIASTPRPEGESDFDGPSPLIFRCTEQPKPACDTLLRPKSTRAFTAHLQLPAGARPAKVVAKLYLSADPEPIATAEQPWPGQT